MLDSKDPRKQTVLNFHQKVLHEGRTQQLDDLVAPAYAPRLPSLRTSPHLPPGVDSLRRRLQEAKVVSNEVHRIVADGDFVFAHVRYASPAPQAGVDIYRLDADRRIAEHWSVRQPIPADAEKDRDRFAAALDVAAPETLDATWLKDRVRTMLEKLWRQGNAALVPDYYARSYIQHNPEMPGGYTRILEVVNKDIRSYMARTQGTFPVEIHRLGAEGDSVFVHISIFMAGINRNADIRSTNVDIFRVDTDGRMFEHWDVLQMENEPPDPSTLF